MFFYSSRSVIFCYNAVLFVYFFINQTLMFKKTAELIYAIDALLPQTQCGLCGHRAGCLPYATAIVEQQESANLCVPGGQPVADAIANLLGRQHLSAVPSVWDIAADGRPQRIKAVIREDECIGCTKCIAACPVDAIIGSGKLMHTVLTADCTGCELCIAPCPVDCIDLVVDASPIPTDEQRIKQQHQFRQRYQAHLIREQNHQTFRPKTTAQLDTQQVQHITRQIIQSIDIQSEHQVVDDLAIIKLRSQIKKLKKQLSVHVNEQKSQQLAQLQIQLNGMIDD
jgi:electron transport complex protein RnfB